LYDLDPKFDLLRGSLENPDNQYLKFLLITHVLAVLLDGMDFKARYPLPLFKYKNITLLMREVNKKAVKDVIIMLDDLVSIVPQVWTKIDIFKLNLQTKR
jgi:hypothetical protein